MKTFLYSTLTILTELSTEFLKNKVEDYFGVGMSPTPKSSQSYNFVTFMPLTQEVMQYLDLTNSIKCIDPITGSSFNTKYEKAHWSN